MGRRWAFRIGATVIVTLIAGEGLLRFGLGLGDPPLVSLHGDTEYELIANRTYWRFGNYVAINEYGMRSDPIPLLNEEDDRRIMLIGDSVVYGNHFLDQSETIGQRLQHLLQSTSHFQTCSPLVVAAAASSWGPVNQAAFLQKTGLLNADLGLLVVSAHDLFDTPDHARVLPYRVQSPLGALDDARQIVMGRFAKDLGSQDRYAQRRAASLAAMDRIAKQFAHADVPLTLVYHSTISERVNSMSSERDIFVDWALSRGLDIDR